MTRIVSGTWRGRKLAIPADTRIRPTAERVREAWLNILGPRLADANVLDLCAGSGALGLEALSRGASRVTCVEQDPATLMTLRQNVATLEADSRVTVVAADVLRFVAGLGAAAFDVAVADPPFASDIGARLVAAWRAVPFAAMLAVEHDQHTSLDGGVIRRWGNVAVTFFSA
jgi:16S rRNA (guanine966-N2)-methyltransferase